MVVVVVKYLVYLSICPVRKAGSAFSSAGANLSRNNGPCHLQIIAPQSCRGTSWPRCILRKTWFESSAILWNGDVKPPQGVRFGVKATSLLSRLRSEGVETGEPVGFGKATAATNNVLVFPRASLSKTRPRVIFRDYSRV